MSSPSSYFALNAELENVKAIAFLFLMSDEVESIDTPLASKLFDLVGDMSEQEANDAIKSFEATKG